MYVLAVMGFVAWLSYGVLLWQWPLIASNGVCFVLSAFILTMKLLPRKEKNAVADTIAKKA